mmetsp:Transcript_126570/g.300640  ORF Transcript_126570/g.300640 Transcript_126570/m.300640 type:complete len:254 (-) Transcript_126570:134-895(-)
MGCLVGRFFCLGLKLGEVIFGLLHLSVGVLHPLLRLLHHRVCERRNDLPRVVHQSLHDVQATVVSTKPGEWLAICGIWVVYEEYPVHVLAHQGEDVPKAPVQLVLALDPGKSLLPLRHIPAGIRDDDIEVQQAFGAPQVFGGVDQPGNDVVCDASAAHHEKHRVHPVRGRQCAVTDVGHNLVLVQLSVTQTNGVQQDQGLVRGLVFQHGSAVGDRGRVIPGPEVIVARQEVAQSTLARASHAEHHHREAPARR